MVSEFQRIAAEAEEQRRASVKNFEGLRATVRRISAYRETLSALLREADRDLKKAQALEDEAIDNTASAERVIRQIRETLTKI